MTEEYFFLSGCVVETRQFYGTGLDSNRVFPHPARLPWTGIVTLGNYSETGAFRGLAMRCGGRRIRFPGGEIRSSQGVAGVSAEARLELDGLAAKLSSGVPSRAEV